MDPMGTIRRELLRLAGTKHHPVCVNTRRISAIYNVPERSVRRELTKLAEEKRIHLAGWDGRQMRSFDSWTSAEEFVESKLDEGHVHLDLWEPQSN